MVIDPDLAGINSRWHGAVARYLCANLTSVEPNYEFSFNEMTILDDSVSA